MAYRFIAVDNGREKTNEGKRGGCARRGA
jgi:hypothetical protein